MFDLIEQINNAEIYRKGLNFEIILCWCMALTVMEQPLSPLSYLFDLINYASLILLNKLSILFHPIIVWPCG